MADETPKKRNYQRSPFKPRKAAALQISQERVDFILTRIEKLDNDWVIGEAVAQKFGVTKAAGYKNVQQVWKALAREADFADRPLHRGKTAKALEKIYVDSLRDADLRQVTAQLASVELTDAQRAKILTKYDPHRARDVARKALDSYAKLLGLNAPEKVEVDFHGQEMNPKTMTPQERRERISELMTKGSLALPVGNKATDN